LQLIEAYSTCRYSVNYQIHLKCIIFVKNVEKVRLVKIIITALAILQINEAYGQKFSAAIVLGANASQIDGDGYAGYSKLGLSTGARLMYNLGLKSNLSIEFLYSQRGSRARLFKNNPEFGLDQNYAEIPVLFSYDDWYIEKDGYSKVGIDAGLSYGRIINSSSKSVDFDDFIQKAKPNDLSYVVGLRYRYSKALGINFRYTRSLAKMYTNQNLEYGGLLGYFLTFRLEYYL
jgi:hypothetical protein